MQAPNMPSDDDLSDAPKDLQAKLTTHTSKHGEVCTAVEMTAGGSMTVLVFTDPDGNVIFQINTSYYADGAVICDVIDVERQFPEKRALVDPGSSRDNARPAFTYLVSADMRMENR